VDGNIAMSVMGLVAVESSSSYVPETNALRQNIFGVEFARQHFRVDLLSVNVTSSPEYCM
jgi:hypothetical protein